ncbi:UNVERIFIED_CONTAM: hypothetical protein FKN15_044506 [Acipenser sinensis]
MQSGSLYTPCKSVKETVNSFLQGLKSMSKSNQVDSDAEAGGGEAQTVATGAVMVGLRYLHTSLESLSNPEDPESASEGWLLEKSVKETVNSFLQGLKSMSKSNQVDSDAEAGGGEAQTVATVS